MKLISWNCNMAYRKKAYHLLAFNPDIVIIPECECPEKLKVNQFDPAPNDVVWYGDNPSKGLGIFSYSDYCFKLHDWHNPAFKTILPLSVSNGQDDFTVFAVWANNPQDPDSRYIEQIWKAINHYESHLSCERTILVGEFNSNVIWDKKHRHGNHSDLVKYLEGHGIQSIYHQYFNQPYGKEEHPTLFMYRHQDKPYHIDYCFASKDLLEKVIEFVVGGCDEWIGKSDHMPLMVEFRK